MRRVHFLGLFDGQFVVGVDHGVSLEFRNVLVEVPGKGVVIVDDKGFHGEDRGYVFLQFQGFYCIFCGKVFQNEKTMSLRTQYEFLFVGRDEDSFVENYAYDLGEGGERIGKIFINLEIQNNPAEAEDIGELIFDSLRKKFFADLEDDPYVRFEKALKEVNRELKNLRSQKSSQFLGNLHVIIAAIVDNNIFLTQCGEAEAYLIRRKYCSVISDDLYDPESKDFFTNIASGTIEPEDFVLLSSTRLLRYISKNDFARIGSSKSLVGALGEAP